jgi:biopolymer transport protein ExbB
MQSWITSLVLVVLVLLSVLTWTIGVVKFKDFRRALRQDEIFSRSLDRDHFLKEPKNLFSSDLVALQSEVLQEICRSDSKEKTMKLAEVVERKLSQKMGAIMKVYERGHSELATIASSAPFIGLFGTVWGIMEALKNIGLSGHVTIETIAGPVGEALITTAIGIATALPAVYFHNYIARQLQLRLSRLEDFSTDLMNAILERY